MHTPKLVASCEFCAHCRPACTGAGRAPPDMQIAAFCQSLRLAARHAASRLPLAAPTHARVSPDLAASAPYRQLTSFCVVGGRLARLAQSARRCRLLAL